MVKYILGFFVLSPLAGLIMMENGAFGVSVAQFGYENGASAAYLAYAAAFLAVFALATRSSRTRPPQIQRSAAFQADFRTAAVLVLALNMAFLLTIMWGFGGYQVLTAAVGKGEFRATLGAGGALAYLVTKFFAPALLAYLTVLYVREGRSGRHRALLLLNYVIGFALGLGWGFKTTAIWIVLPSLIILYWRLPVRRAAGFSLGVPALLVGMFMLFDRDGEALLDVLEQLWIRATVIQGDVSWLVWDMQRNGEPFPNYWITLLPAIGDRLLTALTAVSKENYVEWIAYHYDLLLTQLVGYPVEGIEGGHTVTGTPFSEGLIAFGSPGFLLAGVVAGLVVAWNYRLMRASLERGRAIICAMATTYFAFATLPWLNGGGIIQLFHLSVWVALFVTWLLLAGIAGVRRPRILRRRAAPRAASGAAPGTA